MMTRLQVRLPVAIMLWGLGWSQAIWAAGSVSGKVEYQGTLPKAEVLKMSSDPYCAAAHSGQKVTSEDLLLNSNHTLGNIFVYVKEGVKPGLVPPIPTTPVEFNQMGCLYRPALLGMRVGQTLHIVNSDPTMHNVHALPKVNSGFNVGMATQGNTRDQKFDHPEMGIHMKCDVHPWMNAYINVLDHPYFAISDSQGKFIIAGLPPGQYTLEAWHHNPKVGSKTIKVTVKEGKASTANFVF